MCIGPTNVCYFSRLLTRSSLNNSTYYVLNHASRLGIFVGFAAFFVMEKTLRVLGGGEEGHSHSHSHSHTEPSSGSADSAHASGVHVSTSANELKNRKGDNSKSEDEVANEESHGDVKGPSKLSAYLNLFGDFVHNMYVCFDR